MTVSDNEGGRQQPTPPGRGQAFVFATAAVLVLTGAAVAAVVIWPATATAIEGSQRRYRGTVEPCARHGVSFQTTRTRNCNLDLNNVASNCPDLLCEPRAGRAVSRNLQLEQTMFVLFG
jgi:hypothetical protein